MPVINYSTAPIGRHSTCIGGTSKTEGSVIELPLFFLPAWGRCPRQRGQRGHFRWHRCIKVAPFGIAAALIIVTPAGLASSTLLPPLSALALTSPPQGEKEQWQFYHRGLVRLCASDTGAWGWCGASDMCLGVARRLRYRCLSSTIH